MNDERRWHPSPLVDTSLPEVRERLLECLTRLFPEEHQEDIGLYGRQVLDALLDNETYRMDVARARKDP